MEFLSLLVLSVHHSFLDFVLVSQLKFKGWFIKISHVENEQLVVVLVTLSNSKPVGLEGERYEELPLECQLEFIVVKAGLSKEGSECLTRHEAVIL